MSGRAADKEGIVGSFEELVRLLAERSLGRFIPEYGWRPLVDIYQADDRLVVIAEMPGIPSEDISIEVSDDTLTLSGRKTMPEHRGTSHHRLETDFGEFERSLSLPCCVNTGRCAASLKDGILRMELPIADSEIPRRIAIEDKEGLSEVK